MKKLVCGVLLSLMLVAPIYAEEVDPTWKKVGRVCCDIWSVSCIGFALYNIQRLFYYLEGGR